MVGLDSTFFEQFKRLDNLCCNVLGCKSGGVTQYIDSMTCNWAGQQLVPGWVQDYKSLIHVRWVRNKLAHESVKRQLSKREDLEFLEDFCRRIQQGSDPLAKAKKLSGKKGRVRLLKVVIAVVLVGTAAFLCYRFNLISTIRNLLNF